MNGSRRDFLLAGVGFLAGCRHFGEQVSAERPTVRFGVVTDAHYAKRQPKSWSGTSRYYSHSVTKMRQAVELFNRSNLDFAIELGDFKDMGEKPDRTATLCFLEEIEDVFSVFNGPRYHVLGNHDMDCISKEDFFSRTVNHGAANGKSYYSFSFGDVKFVVLDACFNPDGTPYCCRNFDWKKAVLPDDEIYWLDAELVSAHGPVVAFCHQLLDGFSPDHPEVRVSNWRRVVDVMERRGNVRAVFQGHHHSGDYNFRNGIHYWTMKAMIEGPNPPHNSCAIVEVSSKGEISIEGFGDCESRVLKEG